MHSSRRRAGRSGISSECAVKLPPPRLENPRCPAFSATGQQAEPSFRRSGCAERKGNYLATLNRFLIAESEVNGAKLRRFEER
jgi:hypothetical protein